MSAPSIKPPIIVTLAVIAVGVLIAVVGSPLIGAIIAALGVVPSCWAAWVGMQGETQAGLAMAILMGLVSLAVGGLLILLKVVNLFS